MGGAIDIQIFVDDLDGQEIAALLGQHLELMASVTPAESIHALDLKALKAPEVTFWSAWRRNALVGCGALKELDPQHGEIKSMHTAKSFRGQGIGQALLDHIIGEARTRGYGRLSLETGSMKAFEAARAFYLKNGFQRCAPFADYEDDPNNVFMTRPVSVS